MARRILLTALAVLLAAAAFAAADPIPDVNLFGIVFLLAAVVVWFCWGDIQAGYAYLDENGASRDALSRLTMLRFAATHLRQLSRKKPRSR